MLKCKKCRQLLDERISQQSLNDIETVLANHERPIAAHRKAMSVGPLCDPCLVQWQTKVESELRHKELLLDTRSLAIKRLDEACLRMPVESRMPRGGN